MQIYDLLALRFDHRDWWHADSPFEVVVGAILTQQTTWSNVESCIANIKRANLLDLELLSHVDVVVLGRLIRSSGFYKQKARRLKQLCCFIVKEYGTLEKLMDLEINALRTVLLSLEGIGKETADSIMLYAGAKPVFVIDAYTRRMMHRLDPRVDIDTEYDKLRAFFEANIPNEVHLYRAFHANIVELSKLYCRSEPLCDGCPLNKVCSYAALKKP